MKLMKFIENMKKMNKKAIILLSSGLDSLVSLYLAKKEYEIILAITFDYGQKASVDEIEAARKICEKFQIEHKVIKLPFLAEATDNALVNNDDDLKVDKFDLDSMKKVWVPNRNSLFLNVAAVYAEKLNANYIIFGANKEEAQTFSDNSKEFIDRINKTFEFSTQVKPKVIAPCVDMDKVEIVNNGIKQGVDFSLMKSCYNSSAKTLKSHCGECESCLRLKNAILLSDNKNLINLLF